MADLDVPPGHEEDDADRARDMDELQELLAYGAHLGGAPLSDMMFRKLLARRAYNDLLSDLPDKGEGNYRGVCNGLEGL